MPAAAPASESAIASMLADIGAQVLVRGWLSANNIVFRAGAEGASVVDTGYFTHAAQTRALVEQALAGAPLAQVVNTHLHSDHCGGNATLARRWPAARLVVPAGYRAHLEPWNEAGLSYQATDQQCEPFMPQAFVEAGDHLALGGRDWQVHAAPGHDPDAVLLFEPASRTLISGDALWESRLAIIFPELVGEPGFGAAHSALDRIEQLQPRLVLPGHGAPFTQVGAAIAASRQRLDAFAAAPIKHRQHAARALVGYHMLEHRSRPREALIDWIVATPIFRQALQCEGEPLAARELATATVDRLVADGVLALAGEHLSLRTP
jgi:glyoxylase-like metal-dependent hydrolase (beta-lactamase superfamily II)